MDTAADRHSGVMAVVLAAGKGTRMTSDLAKVLHRLGRRTLLDHVLDACDGIGIPATVVVGYQAEAVAAVARARGAGCVLQDHQLGTGHAVLCSEPAVRARPGIHTVLVLCGDCPLVPAALLERVLSSHARARAACTVVGAHLKDPARYGRMITDADGRLKRIVEYRDANDQERAVTLINAGIYAFSVADLFRALRCISPDNAQGEYYLTDVVAQLVGTHAKVELVVAEDGNAVLGINTPEELAAAQQVLGVRAAASGV